MPTAPQQPVLFPLFADLAGRRVVVVGGGPVARRKAEALLEAGAQVAVGAPDFDNVLLQWVHAGRIERLDGDFDPRWLDQAWLVIAATDDAAVNRAVVAAADARRIFANVVDDAAASRFHVPARVSRGPLQIAISSGGGAPMLARLLRERLEAQFDESYGALAQLLTRHRERIRSHWPVLETRRRGMEQLLSGPLRGLLHSGRLVAAERTLDETLRSTPQRPTGSVTLVGAGPGDPGLLTLHALRALNRADVIVHDRLVSDEVLRIARRDAERIDVGKHVGDDHDATQRRIHDLLIAHARGGRQVVRLKGGDPFVFGRGGEELEALRAHGIDYTVVPGVTAATACAAYAGIPLTHRDYAHCVRFLTARIHDDAEHDWADLAQPAQTLAFYMGVSGLKRISACLLAHGRAANTPFAIIENGTHERQRVIAGPLSQLHALARAHQVRSPALVVIGEVAALAQTLHWFGRAPLTLADPPYAPVQLPTAA